MRYGVYIDEILFEFVCVPTQFRVLRVIVGVLILNKGGSAGYLHRVSLALYGPGVCQKLL